MISRGAWNVREDIYPASVIFFLNDLVDDGILDYEEKTGKGGYHRVYYPNMNREEFADHITDLITKKLKTIFHN